MNNVKGPATRALSVIDELRAALLKGEFQPGERLQEHRLSARWSVSRTPVRLALQALASEGLLAHEPNCGYSVRTFDRVEILNAFEIRAAMEGLSARFAAERGLAADEQSRLESILSQGDSLLSCGDSPESLRSAYVRMNTAFHAALHELSGSRMVAEMIRHAQLPTSSHDNVVDFDDRKIRFRHDEHHRVYEAIVRRDAGRAESLMRDHVASIKTDLMSLSSKVDGGLARQMPFLAAIA